MTKHRPDGDRVANELMGASAFFKKTPPEPPITPPLVDTPVITPHTPEPLPKSDVVTSSGSVSPPSISTARPARGIACASRPTRPGPSRHCAPLSSGITTWRSARTISAGWPCMPYWKTSPPRVTGRRPSSDSNPKRPVANMHSRRPLSFPFVTS